MLIAALVLLLGWAVIALRRSGAREGSLKKQLTEAKTWSHRQAQRVVDTERGCAERQQHLAELSGVAEHQTLEDRLMELRSNEDRLKRTYMAITSINGETS